MGLFSPMEILTGERINVEASSRTEGGQVAVNMRVWRPGFEDDEDEDGDGVVAMIFRISSSKPLSSMRSASSRTR